MPQPLYSPRVQAQIDAAGLNPAKQRKKRAHPEQDLQITVVEWLALATRPGEARYWWVPNGNHLSPKQRADSKRMGLTPGVVDLHFAWWGEAQAGDAPLGGQFGVIELKADKTEKPKPLQRQFMADMDDMGHRSGVAWTWAMVRDLLWSWGYPLRSGF